MVDSYDRLIASKRLSRLKIYVSNQIFDMDVIWCRAVYSQSEIWNRKSHYHTFYEMHFALNGYSVFSSPDHNSVLLQKNHFMVFEPKQIHTLSSVSNDYDEFVIGFHINILQDQAEGQFLQQAVEQMKYGSYWMASPHMTYYVDSLLENAYYDHPALTPVINSYLTLFLYEMARQIVPVFPSKQIKRKVFSEDIYYFDVCDFVSKNISNNINSKIVAQKMNMSEKQLNRILQKTHDVTIAQIIEDEKMKRLYELLTTDLTLSQIAEQLGFSNEYNMGRFFKRKEGMSPGRFRRSLKK